MNVFLLFEYSVICAFLFLPLALNGLELAVCVNIYMNLGDF
jgi:hypothetical protein